MDITFVGAAREVTGSCHILHLNGRTVVLDCGLFQGRRADTAEKNRALPLPVDQIDVLILSHAHIDHAGRLPFLVANGYANKIWATSATRDLSAVMLADAAHIQEKDAELLARRGKDVFPPLYTMRHAARAVELMMGVPYDTPVDVLPGVRATFIDAGHILGSASVVVDWTDNGVAKRLVFSGDIGRWGLPIIRDPQPPQAADIVIMESTYGDRDHESVAEARTRLGAIVRQTVKRGGRIIIPSFAVGRTQELVYDLHVLARAGEIPAIPIYIDSPLAIDATTVFEMHPEIFDHSEDLVQKVQKLLQFPLVHYTREVEASKALARLHGPVIIIAASGMAESGRILHHLAQGAGESRNTILIVGFQAEHTLGRRIVERQPFLKIFGDDVPLRAQVEVLNGYSAHADRTELVRWAKGVHATSPRLRKIFLVHGEPAAQAGLTSLLEAEGFGSVESPLPRSRVTVS